MRLTVCVRVLTALFSWPLGPCVGAHTAVECGEFVGWHCDEDITDTIARRTLDC